METLGRPSRRGGWRSLFDPHDGLECAEERGVGAGCPRSQSAAVGGRAGADGEEQGGPGGGPYFHHMTVDQALRRCLGLQRNVGLALDAHAANFRLSLVGLKQIAKSGVA